MIGSMAALWADCPQKVLLMRARSALASESCWLHKASVEFHDHHSSRVIRVMNPHTVRLCVLVGSFEPEWLATVTCRRPLLHPSALPTSGRCWLQADASPGARDEQECIEVHRVSIAELQEIMHSGDMLLPSITTCFLALSRLQQQGLIT